jgi:hypothetical protein
VRRHDAGPAAVRAAACVTIDAVQLLSVGEVAARLGVSPSTVRMWGTRYGLVASARSEGGHRRYTSDDVERLRRMHEAVIAGADPAGAAALALGGADEADGEQAAAKAPGRSGRGGPGGAVLAVPGGSAAARGLARAAVRLDEIGVEDLVVGSLGELGTLRTWDEVVRPVLVAAGEHWERTGSGIEVEHLLTQAVVNAFARHAATSRRVDLDHPVLLAGGPKEEHVLALHALRAALAERGVPARLLGPRTPMTALAGAARKTRAPAVLVWLSRRDRTAVPGLAEVAAAHRRIRVLVGGRGWVGVELGPAHLCGSLAEAVDTLAVAYADAR